MYIDVDIDVYRYMFIVVLYNIIFWSNIKITFQISLFSLCFNINAKKGLQRNSRYQNAFLESNMIEGWVWLCNKLFVIF